MHTKAALTGQSVECMIGGGLGGEEHEVQRRHVGEVMGGVEGWELKVEMIPFPCMHVWNSQE